MESKEMGRMVARWCTTTSSIHRKQQHISNTHCFVSLSSSLLSTGFRISLLHTTDTRRTDQVFRRRRKFFHFPFPPSRVFSILTSYSCSSSNAWRGGLHRKNLLATSSWFPIQYLCCTIENLVLVVNNFPSSFSPQTLHLYIHHRPLTQEKTSVTCFCFRSETLL